MQPRTGAPSLTCLTMHQPWASLLVYGIKRIEGRAWSTEHRGSLWIHAAAKRPSQEDINVSYSPPSRITRLHVDTPPAWRLSSCSGWSCSPTKVPAVLLKQLYTHPPLKP